MKNHIQKNIPNCLRKYRRTRGLKQKDVAEILGIKSTSMISRWEKGCCLPNSINIFRLSLLYRTMVDALFIDLLKQLKDDLQKREEKIFRIHEDEEKRK